MFSRESSGSLTKKKTGEEEFVAASLIQLEDGHMSDGAEDEEH